MKYGVPVQKNIFLKGMAGRKPSIPVAFKNLELKAKDKLSKKAYAYIAGGAGEGTTIRANRNGFSRYSFKANMMQATTQVDMDITLFGNTYKSPLIAAPIGALELAHKKADKAVARACSDLDIPMAFSNQASYSMEDCVNAMGDSPRWFQLYWSKSDDLVKSFLGRAEMAGCDAIIVTLDTTSLGWRPQDLDLGYLPFLHGQGIAQYSSDPIFNQLITDNEFQQEIKSGELPPITYETIKNILQLSSRYPGSFFTNLLKGRAMAAVRTFINIYMRPSLRWSDLSKLRQMTSLPIIVKGIQTVEDAQKAIEENVDGIIVSNHGGRQIDGGVAAIQCLDEICNTITPAFPVLFDSGIRSGADVLKALSLGAHAVLVGRPYVYGLALDGRRGAEAVFKYLLAEMELQLSLMGIASISELNRSFLYKN